MKKWKPLLALVLVFFAGIVVGVVGARIVTRGVINFAVRHPDKVRERIEHDLVRRLQLDTDQQAKVHTTLLDTQKQLADLRNDFQPRLEDLMYHARTNINEILTPEQKVKFDKWREQNRRFFPH